MFHPPPPTPTPPQLRTGSGDSERRRLRRFWSGPEDGNPVAPPPLRPVPPAQSLFPTKTRPVISPVYPSAPLHPQKQTAGAFVRVSFPARRPKGSRLKAFRLQSAFSKRLRGSPTNILLPARSKNNNTPTRQSQINTRACTVGGLFLTKVALEERRGYFRRDRI